MSAAWAVAVVALALLVLALAAVLARLLTVVTSLDRTLAGVQEQVRHLRLDSIPSGSVEVPAAPATALVSLDPGCASCRDLALDLQASGVPRVPGLVLRLLVEDSAAGRALAGGLDVEPVEPDPGGAARLPHVLVAAGDGRVLAKGDPASVAELERMLAGVA
ncbi:MAG TPA: hypothetical protein VK894_15475 [Jiangellales bacterium]|nr:hypothetical protein [Jiangellales bacterium]